MNFFDDNKILKQTFYAIEQIQLKNDQIIIDNLNQFLNMQIYKILPNGITFGVSYIVVFGILLFFSIDVKYFTLLMMAY